MYKEQMDRRKRNHWNFQPYKAMLRIDVKTKIFELKNNDPAIKPMINGAIIAPMIGVSYAFASCKRDALNDCERNVPIVTNHPPQIKKFRNIIKRRA